MAFLRRLLGWDEPKSGEVAKQRLQLVLVHDRANISPALLALIKDEIINVISQHIEIDQTGVEVNFTQEGSESCLMANIPLTNVAVGRRNPTSGRD
jgi:cell division topological specificity factor